jgi:hypothetical protein
MNQAIFREISFRLSSYRELLHPVVILSVSRPLVILQSDDWGMAGIDDKDRVDRITKDYPRNPASQHLDYYSVETKEDLSALYEVLSSHRDSMGNHPILGCNFIMANVDSRRVVEGGFEKLFLQPLHGGLPWPWKRPGLLEAYGEGICRQYLYPALHGVTHFCYPAVERIIREDAPRGRLLRNLLRIGAPQAILFSPWAGYEFRDDESGWLSLAEQEKTVTQGRALFRKTFGRPPLSACAPGYRANAATFRAWGKAGIKVVQNGPGLKAPPFIGRHGLLHLHRNAPFEPAIDPGYFTVERAFQAAQRSVEAGGPIIICTHSVNFHSTLRNFRDLTLERLHQLLSRLEDAFSDLMYIHDEDLWHLVRKGEFSRNGKAVSVKVSRKLGVSPALKHLLSQKCLGERRHAG